ncbi:MAG: hypothetical protein ACRETB_11310 [Steroidobacteraceae bacterium]
MRRVVDKRAERPAQRPLHSWSHAPATIHLRPDWRMAFLRRAYPDERRKPRTVERAARSRRPAQELKRWKLPLALRPSL